MWLTDRILALEVKINGLEERINELQETNDLILNHLKVKKVVYPEQITLESEKKSKKKYGWIEGIWCFCDKIKVCAIHHIFTKTLDIVFKIRYIIIGILW